MVTLLAVKLTSLTVCFVTYDMQNNNGYYTNV